MTVKLLLIRGLCLSTHILRVIIGQRFVELWEDLVIARKSKDFNESEWWVKSRAIEVLQKKFRYPIYMTPNRNQFVIGLVIAEYEYPETECIILKEVTKICDDDLIRLNNQFNMDSEPQTIIMCVNVN